jgi:hypothetical protein
VPARSSRQISFTTPVDLMEAESLLDSAGAPASATDDGTRTSLVSRPSALSVNQQAIDTDASLSAVEASLLQSSASLPGASEHRRSPPSARTKRPTAPAPAPAASSAEPAPAQQRQLRALPTLASIGGTESLAPPPAGAGAAAAPAPQRPVPSAATVPAHAKGIHSDEDDRDDEFAPGKLERERTSASSDLDDSERALRGDSMGSTAVLLPLHTAASAGKELPWWRKVFLTQQLTGISNTAPGQAERERYMDATLRELIVYALFLCVYCVIIFGMLTSLAFPFTNSMRAIYTQRDFADNRQFFDINTIKDVHDYLQGPFLAATYTTWPATPDQIFGDNLLLGVPALRQLRVRNNSCSVPSDFASLVPSCFAGYSPGDEQTTAFGPGNMYVVCVCVRVCPCVSKCVSLNRLHLCVVAASLLFHSPSLSLGTWPLHSIRFLTNAHGSGTRTPLAPILGTLPCGVAWRPMKAVAMSSPFFEQQTPHLPRCSR